MTTRFPGTEGYAQEAPQLLQRYEAFPFEEAHKRVTNLIPQDPGCVLDIGAGTGRDAAYLADNGHHVTAVEPTDELREGGRKLHPSPLIEWVADGLPCLTSIANRKDRYELVMMTAVWMHLNEAERAQAMPVVATLLKPGCHLILSLRHGPVPEGRRMFAVTADETIQLAAAERLRPILNIHTEALQEPNRSAGVTWTRLAFLKPN